MNVVGMDQQSESYFTVEVEPDKLKTLKVCASASRKRRRSPAAYKFEVEDKIITKAAPTSHIRSTGHEQMNLAKPNREFTGRYMLAIMVAFFSVIITVNLTMAFLARSSWTGFVAENTRREPPVQHENGGSAPQAALGWKSELAIANGKVSRLTRPAMQWLRSGQPQISDGPHMPRKIRKWRWSASLTACCPHPPSCAMVSGVSRFRPRSTPTVPIARRGG